jgi:hypothetical protein
VLGYSRKGLSIPAALETVLIFASESVRSFPIIIPRRTLAAFFDFTQGVARGDRSFVFVYRRVSGPHYAKDPPSFRRSSLGECPSPRPSHTGAGKSPLSKCRRVDKRLESRAGRTPGEQPRGPNSLLLEITGRRPTRETAPLLLSNTTLEPWRYSGGAIGSTSPSGPGGFFDHALYFKS